jgi:hypothetical protein
MRLVRWVQSKAFWIRQAGIVGSRMLTIVASGSSKMSIAVIWLSCVWDASTKRSAG